MLGRKDPFRSSLYGKITKNESIKSRLESENMLSINEMQAQIKLLEMWKLKHNDNYPLNLEVVKMTESGRTTRSATNEKYKLNNTPHTCIGDTTRMWNKAPSSITNAKSIQIEKKTFCKNCQFRNILEINANQCIF